MTGWEGAFPYKSDIWAETEAGEKFKQTIAKEAAHAKTRIQRPGNKTA